MSLRNRTAAAAAAAGALLLMLTCTAAAEDAITAEPAPDVVLHAELERLRAALEQAHAESDRLRQALTARDAELDGLRAAIADRERHEQQLNGRLDALRARLPAAEGGSLTPDEIRDRAAAEAAELKRLIEQGRGIDNPQLHRQLRETENALHRSQALLARADSARTIHRLRPGDSLARVSWLFYGDSDLWSRIFDANRHILDTPDEALPGLTLVIP